MSGVNKVILVGRIGKDPEVKTIGTGKMVANVSMATSETYKDSKGDKKEVTEWHNLVIWEGLAGIVQKYVKKGDQLYIEGKLRTKSWEKDGIKRYVTEVLVNELVMLGGKSGESKPSSSQPSTPSSAGTGNGFQAKTSDPVPNEDPRMPWEK